MKQVEETEGRADKQAQEITELKQQVKDLQIDQRKILYKLEDQENKGRRQNLFFLTLY